MFKALVLSLALIPTLGQADVIGTTPVEVLNGGCYGTPSGSLTYALNQGLTGTSSAAIDLSGTVGIMLTLTSTGSSKVLVYFSNGNLTYTTGASQMYSFNSPGSYCIQPKARYVSFYNAGTLPTNRVSAFYYSVVAPNTSSSGGTVNAFITGTVKVDAQGSSVVAFQASSYVYASSTAFQVTTAGLAVNISHVAGATCNDCRVYWQAPASIYWDYGATSSIPGTLGATTGFTLTANVTPLLDDGFIDGQHIIFKAQASTVNIPVIVRKRQ